jgi:hypothetical protein
VVVQCACHHGRNPGFDESAGRCTVSVSGTGSVFGYGESRAEYDAGKGKSQGLEGR